MTAPAITGPQLRAFLAEVKTLPASLPATVVTSSSPQSKSLSPSGAPPFGKKGQIEGNSEPWKSLLSTAGDLSMLAVFCPFCPCLHPL